jgi:formate dehydrogenase subunit gamma
VGPWGRRLRADARRFSRWSRDELGWLRSLGRSGLSNAGKFNPGQKLNAVFVAGTIVVMLGTGAILRWFGPFPDSWRTGATFVHDVLATAVFVVVAGHVAFALTHRDALRSMVTGRISRAWARRNAPEWLDELLLEPPAGQMPRGSRELSQPSRATAQRKA